jgi:hypothetical protein
MEMAVLEPSRRLSAKLDRMVVASGIEVVSEVKSLLDGTFAGPKAGNYLELHRRTPER